MGKQPWVTHGIVGRERSKHRSRDSCQVSGTALAAGMAANPLDHEPEASALPLTSRSNDAKTLSSARQFRSAWACAVFWFWAVPAVSEDWPSFRGPQHNGVSAEAGWLAQWPESGPKIVWRQDVGIGVASFAVVGPRVITMGNRADQDLVWCLDADSGRVLWQFAYPCTFEERCFEGGTASTPTVDGSFVYTLAYDGQVHCLRLEDGRIVWQKHLVNDFGGRLSNYKYAGSSSGGRPMGAQAEGQFGAQFARTEEWKGKLPTDRGRPHLCETCQRLCSDMTKPTVVTNETRLRAQDHPSWVTN